MLFDKNGFVKLPELSNITIKPPEDYNLPTSGLIHAQKFNAILKYILDVNTTLDELKNELEGHNVYQILRDLKKNQIADYCKHILMLNRKSPIFSWDEIDNAMLYINQLYPIAGWELPNIMLLNEVSRDFKSLIIEISIPQVFLTIINKLMSEIVNTSLGRMGRVTKINSLRYFMRFYDLCTLLDIVNSDIICNRLSITRAERVKVNRFLSQFFIETIENSIHSFNMRFLMIARFVRNYIHTGEDGIKYSQKLMDRLKHDLDRFKREDAFILQFLLGASYGYTTIEILKSNLSFIARRKMVNALITNFVQTDDYDYTQIFETLIENDVDKELIFYILNGYLAINQVIENHIRDLPESNTRKRLINTSRDLITAVDNFVNKFLEQECKITDLHSMRYVDYNKQLKDHLVDARFIYMMNDVIIQLYTVNYFRVNFPLPFEPLKRLTFFSSLISDTKDEMNGRLFTLAVQLLYNSYPFESLIVKMNEDMARDDILFHSRTFEDNTIRIVSEFIEYLQKSDNSNYSNLINSYKVLILFFGEWLQRLKDEEMIYPEALMIISPIISFCLVQISQRYFELDRSTEAFLNYINLHYFMIFFNQELLNTEVWKMRKSDEETTKDDILKKFNSIIQGWSLVDLITLKEANKFIAEFELSFSNLSVTSGGDLDGMVEDDIIIFFMDLSADLEDFIQQIVGPDADISEMIRGTNLYQKPIEDTYDVFQFLGYNTHKTNGPESPFPLIRDIHNVASAISLFPISLESVEIMANYEHYSDFIDIMSGSGDK
jgi:hypothetical protein